jgi:hypothetical protein
MNAAEHKKILTDLLDCLMADVRKAHAQYDGPKKRLLLRDAASVREALKSL